MEIYEISIYNHGVEFGNGNMYFNGSHVCSIDTVLICISIIIGSIILKAKKKK